MNIGSLSPDDFCLSLAKMDPTYYTTPGVSRALRQFGAHGRANNFHGLTPWFFVSKNSNTPEPVVHDSDCYPFPAEQTIAREHGPAVEESLWWLCAHGDAQGLDDYLANLPDNTDREQHLCERAPNSCSSTALMIACFFGHDACVKIILSAAIAISIGLVYDMVCTQMDDAGNTALSIAFSGDDCLGAQCADTMLTYLRSVAAISRQTLDGTGNTSFTVRPQCWCDRVNVFNHPPLDVAHTRRKKECVFTLFKFQWEMAWLEGTVSPHTTVVRQLANQCIHTVMQASASAMVRLFAVPGVGEHIPWTTYEHGMDLFSWALANPQPSRMLETLLHLAPPRVVRQRIGQKQRPYCDLVHRTCEKLELDALLVLLRHPSTAVNRREKCNLGAFTPLMMLLEQSDNDGRRMEMVAALVDDPRTDLTASENGHSVLSLAITNSDPDMLRILLRQVRNKRLNLQQYVRNHTSPLLLACQSPQNPDAVAALLAAASDAQINIGVQRKDSADATVEQMVYLRAAVLASNNQAILAIVDYTGHIPEELVLVSKLTCNCTLLCALLKRGADDVDKKDDDEMMSRAIDLSNEYNHTSNVLTLDPNIVDRILLDVRTQRTIATICIATRDHIPDTLWPTLVRRLCKGTPWEKE